MSSIDDRIYPQTPAREGWDLLTAYALLVVAGVLALFTSTQSASVRDVVESWTFYLWPALLMAGGLAGAAGVLTRSRYALMSATWMLGSAMLVFALSLIAANGAAGAGAGVSVLVIVLLLHAVYRLSAYQIDVRRAADDVRRGRIR